MSILDKHKYIIIKAIDFEYVWYDILFYYNKKKKLWSQI